MEVFDKTKFKKNYKRRDWCFTDFNTENTEAYLKMVDDGIATYIICGIEKCPTNDNLHIQGYVRFHHQKAFSAVKKLLKKSHFESCLGTPEDNVDYCKGLCEKKGFTLNKNIFERGTPSNQGRRTDIEDVLFKARQGGAKYLNIINEHQHLELQYGRRIKEIIQDHTKPRKHRTQIYWLKGAPGIGKTTALMKIFPEAEFLEFDGKFFSPYFSSEVVILDDHHTGENDLTKEHILSIGNSKPYKIRVLNGYSEFLAQKCIIVNNYNWSKYYEDVPEIRRRIQVIDCDKLTRFNYVCEKLLRSTLKG